MAPISVHQYQPRAVDKGTVMTVFFTLIASLALLSVFIWAFLIPYLRKKYFPSKPSRTKFNQSTPPLGVTSTTLTQSPVRKQMRAEGVRTGAYHNAPLQTTFPRILSDPEIIPLPAYTPRRDTTFTMDTNSPNNGLFTPVQDRIVTCPHPANNITFPRSIGQSEQVNSASANKDFGDAREYILAVPEPLRVRSHLNGEHLAAANTLNMTPGSDRRFAPADKHPHPKKLFEQLSQKHVWNSECSTTTLKASQEPLNSAAVGETDPGYDGSDESEVSDLSEVLQEPRQQVAQTLLSSHSDEDMKALSRAFTAEESEEESNANPHNLSIAAMHRLRTYRSLVGAPPPEPLSRAGTLTRPKTPVATMRDAYDKKTGDGQIAREAVSRNDTISTLFRTVATGSDSHSSRTSATSLQKSSPPKPFTASAVSLLPTPLTINRSPDLRSVSTPTKRNSKFKEELDNDHKVLRPINIVAKNMKDEVNFNKPSDPAAMVGRPRPAPLTFAVNARLPTPQNNPSRANEPHIDTRPKFYRPPVPSMQASSIYSRNTQGLSIAQTPATPEFHGPGLHRPPFSPFLPSTIGNNTDSDKGTEVHLIKQNKSPVVDTANAKVENWNVDTSGLEFDTSPSPSLKRALSSLGPECRSTHDIEESEEEEDVHSAISTDIHPSEARLSSVIGSPLRASVCTDVAIRSSGLAPGGAGWI